MKKGKSSKESFNFEEHGSKAIKEYQKLKTSYERFADEIKKILRESLISANIKVASIEARSKTEQSFFNKAIEPSLDNPNLPKYPNPLQDITDLAGVRIITFFPNTVDEVNKIIGEEFIILEKSDKSDILKQEEKFGYQSVHYLVSLKSNRDSLKEYQFYKGLVAEIQVRTILQHAWAEIEHDIQYKSIENIPSPIHRRFITLAGLLEVADREFQAIQDAKDDLTKNSRDSFDNGRYEDVEITPEALKIYLDKKLGSDGRMTDFSYDWETRLMRKLGFSNFLQIDECISNFDGDQLSTVVWGYRQGQLSRFELQLLVGMGKKYVKLHPWGKETWFVKARNEDFELIKEAGIKIGNYTPS